MPCVTKIMFDNIAHSDALELQAREEIQQLERFFPNLQSCHVTVNVPHKHQHHGVKYEVRIHLTVPGAELTVDHQADNDAYVALCDAFVAARRRLQDFEGRRRSHKHDE